MNMREFKAALKKVGGVRKAAAEMDISTQAVYQWVNRQRKIPDDRAKQLRALVAQQVSQ